MAVGHMATDFVRPRKRRRRMSGRLAWRSLCLSLLLLSCRMLFLGQSFFIGTRTYSCMYLFVTHVQTWLSESTADRDAVHCKGSRSELSLPVSRSQCLGFTETDTEMEKRGRQRVSIQICIVIIIFFNGRLPLPAPSHRRWGSVPSAC